MPSDRYIRLMRDNAKASGRKPVKAEYVDGEATIYLYDMIANNKADAEWWGGVSPEEFVTELNAIDAPVIHLRINSPGGAVFGARAIEAAIRGHKSKIIAHVDGYAASAASFVAIACTEVEIAKGAFLMIHKAWSCMCGNSDDFMSQAEFLDKIDGTLADSYAEKCGKPASDMLTMMEAETWFTGQEAVDIGLADRLMDGDAKASAWNLSAYENAPATEEHEHPATGGEDEDDGDNRERYERLSRIHGNVRPESRAA